MKRSISANAALAVFFAAVSVSPAAAAEHEKKQTPAALEKPAQLGKPGDKIRLGASHYFIWNFDKPPKMGTRVVKIEIFSGDGKKDTSFEVKGELDMPSMRGSHSSGRQGFQLSNKGDYLLPVRLVMPGEWELVITIFKNGKVVHRGSHLFKI